MKTRLLLRPAACLLLACPGLLLSAAAPAPAPVEDKITLPTFKVQGNAICSFGFGLVATWNEKTQSIGHVYVDDVGPGSLAEQAGMKRGDEILSLNGKKIPEMKGGMKRGSDLFELLVNQPVGKTIDVEVAVHVVKKVVLAATP
jgi:S1-C subfamily serine protease